MIYLGIFFFFALRFYPMAIFKMEVSMVIEEIYHRRGETGQNLLEILPQSTTESPASGPHTHDKRETEQVSFLANLAFWLLFAVSLTGLWLYFICLVSRGLCYPPPGPMPYTSPIIRSFTLHLLSAPSMDLLASLISKRTTPGHL